MDFLKKISDACRLHYEKFLLTLVLLVLAAAVVYLNKTKTDEEDKLREFSKGVESRKKTPLKLVETAANDAARKLITSPPSLNFSLPHHLFNPVKWQRRPPPETDLIKMGTGKEMGWPKMTGSHIPRATLMRELTGGIW